MKKIKTDYSEEQVVKNGCDWCLEDLKNKYGQNQEFEDPKDCSYRGICTELGICGVELTIDEYERRAEECF